MKKNQIGTKKERHEAETARREKLGMREENQVEKLQRKKIG